jgi:Bromodomain
LSVLEDLRALKYNDKGTKIIEPAMAPFEKPVSLSAFPDYATFVQEPMDLQTVDRKIKIGSVYETPEDFEYDMSLIWKNSETYNSQRNDQHSVAMAKFAARKFKTIYYLRMQAFEDPTSVSQPKQSVSPDKQQSTSSPSYQPNKKIKIDASGTSKGKSAPRISITASSLAASAAIAKATSAQQKKPSVIVPRQLEAKSNQPVPLHIAIAKVKEAFPLRRAVKTLQSWEADCARYFKELMRHPWITTARPKFIFHVPVPTLFPELIEIYAAKIRKPMDLTTVECTLLAGNRYAGPEDFLQDIALVFANAIRFNKDGKDVGDPLSCAYYDASVHLLRYARWLSLEILIGHIDRKSEHSDMSGADGLPPLTWKLTDGNRKVARQEIESIVLKEPLEKSLEGDRFTWMESECEKLLKSLRHQSDLRYMTFFIQPNYPADYTAFISKPMDWERVQRNLKKRVYDTIGQVIDDLRLIFSNALKYNARLKGTDTVSGRAYDAAMFMSNKLEAAISKILLSASDRLERERIDHTNAEREIDAAEKAEEAAIRAAWKKNGDDDGTKGEEPPPEIRNEMIQKARTIRRVPQHRRHQATDFEIPFFDEEDDGQHERSYFEVVKFQKSMFEKQRLDLMKMRKATAAIGVSVLTRLIKKDMAAKEALRQTLQLEAAAAAAAASDGNQEKTKSSDTDSVNQDILQASSVLGVLERDGRGQLKMSIAIQKPKKKAKKRSFHGFGDDD